MSFTQITLMLLLFLAATAAIFIGLLVLVTNASNASPSDWFLAALSLVAVGSGYRSAAYSKYQEKQNESTSR